MSVAWNNNGSQLATTCKGQKMRIYDPRDSKAVATVDCNSGTKKNTVIFADTPNFKYLIGVTFNKTATRQLQIWDPRDLSKTLVTQDIDSASGVFVAHFDPDNSILWLAGKGDAVIRYFEIVPEAPHAHFLTQYTDNVAQKGACFLPKRTCDTKKCEIMRCMRVMVDSVIPVSFSVPRKSDLFQKDLYPDAYAGVPALSAQEYKDGKNAEPVLVSMKPGESEKLDHKKSAAVAFTKSSAEYEAEIASLKAKVAELEAALAKK
jgi:coronin-1B/1C/6